LAIESGATNLEAHNLKVTGSNPVPATKTFREFKDLRTTLLTKPRFRQTAGSTVEALWKQEGAQLRATRRILEANFVIWINKIVVSWRTEM
jgi:hypothetical protein